MVVNIESKIEIWKNKLLDLGKRNKLLNYRETKRSTLRIIAPGIYEFWNSFVKNEKPLEFPYYDDIEDEEDINLLTSIETNQSIKDMQKTLRSLRDKAKTATEEQGINILYLSFGFLEWNESKDSEQFFRSPLILVPVTLTVESISSPYVLSLHEDEILINPTLQYKIGNDFGISLPEFGEEDDLLEYFSNINTLVAHNRWKVVEETSLSLLSFLKINMYNDLAKHRDRIIRNSIVRTISGDASASNPIPEEINDYDFDAKIKPIDTFQVVDADSSQQDTILCAKNGLSFVLQGPPGTGKSQTITNIISECLADGKKVLFVSEKMAALDVVYRRLTAAGLNDFCLVLHSYKANKKAVLEQLEAVLNLAKNKAQLSDDAYLKLDTLERDREKLNQYAAQLFEKVEPLGKSIYEVNGVLANLDDYADVIFPIENIDKADWNQYSRYIYVLSEFISSIGKMSADYNANPWHGTNVQSVSNELRHDIYATLPTLSDKLKNYQIEMQKIYQELSLNLPISYTVIEDVIEVLNLAKDSPIVPSQWILGGEIATLFDEVSECEALKSDFIEMQTELKTQYALLQDLDKNIFLSDINSLQTYQKIAGEKENLTNLIKNTKVLCAIDSVESYDKLIDEKTEAQDKVATINSKKSKLLQVFEKEIFDVDYIGILGRYRTEYTSFFKYFKNSYKADKKQFQFLYKDISAKINDEIILSTIDALKKIAEGREWLQSSVSCFREVFFEDFNGENTDFQKIEQYILLHKVITDTVASLNKLYDIAVKSSNMEANLITHYSFLYNGLDTSWENIRKSLTWSVSFREIVEKNKLGTTFVEKVCGEKEIVTLCSAYKEQLIQMKQDIDIEFVWYLKLFDDANKLKMTAFPELIERIGQCNNGLFLLEEWIDFRNARKNCREEGLSEYIEKIEVQKIEPSYILPIFKKRFFRLWLDAILPNYPAALNFRRINQENTIQEFASLDKIQFEIAKARIKGKLINDLPSFDHFTSGVDEISILKRELSKRRKIMPIRKLFQQIPNLLPTLKPCLMMSPLSVSLFLEAETYQFDTVIFDEASQICTENAIGAIARGKQVIIAGDSKQLPPTNFFGAFLSDVDYDTDEEDEDDGTAYESILDEANLLPERTLLWHYRSRHEHLIAFSNAKIYKNNLITFPSNVDKVADNGVEYEYVREGFYDRGGKKGNVIEAKRVGEIVFEHFKKHPNRSIGVIAFGEVQQQAIDTAIRKMRMENQVFESFFNEDKEEPFFVKNLENVQGDERDTIVFSIGYAKDVNGVFRMNLGPLSKSGGERRLNVAITRAKYNVKLVGSILPTDINIEKITSDGPKLLRAYIDFALNGVASLSREITESDIVEHDSPFEKAVYNFLDRKGYKLGTQVGCSGYRIDMAVKHPTLSGQYVLGIECDGAAYHSARTARERDRLRQDVLEQMGWKIYRIWSTDWIKDHVTEGAKLIEAVENALKNYAVSYEEIAERDEPKADDFVSIKKKTVSLNDQLNPYGFGAENEVSFSDLHRNYSGHLSMEDCILEVVNKRFPIHYDLLCKELAPLLGNEKSTVKVKREVDCGLSKVEKQIIRKGDFLFPIGYCKITPRQNNTRKIDYVSEEELEEVMMAVLDKWIGATKETLCTETARAYNYNRMTQNISVAMDRAFELLLKGKRIEVLESKVVKKNNM
jgi:DnaB-like helicase C terminal domain.